MYLYVMQRSELDCNNHCYIFSQLCQNFVNFTKGLNNCINIKPCPQTGQFIQMRRLWENKIIVFYSLKQSPILKDRFTFSGQVILDLPISSSKATGSGYYFTRYWKDGLQIWEKNYHTGSYLNIQYAKIRFVKHQNIQNFSHFHSEERS